MSEIRITCPTFFLYWHWARFRAVSDFRSCSSPKRSCCFVLSRARNACSSRSGERFRSYAQSVPRLLPSLRPRLEDEGQLPRWRQALWDQAFHWGFVATLLAFAFTLSDPIGYAFAGATLSFLVLQKLVQARLIRMHRT